MSVLVVSDAHVCAPFFFLGFVFCLSCLVNNGLPWVLVCGVGFGVFVFLY